MNRARMSSRSRASVDGGNRRSSVRGCSAARAAAQIRDSDVQIATTPKREVFRQDKTTLYHYEPMAKKTDRTFRC